MEKSTYLKNKIVEHNVRHVAYTSPTTVYLALYTTDPTVADSGTEVTGGSYARQSATFGAASGGVCANTGSISFTNMPAATVTHAGIRDASTSGNLLYFTPLDASIAVTAGSTVTFSVGSVTVTEG